MPKTLHSIKSKDFKDFTPDQLAKRYARTFKILFDKLPPDIQKKVLTKGYHDKSTDEFARIVAEVAESKGKL